MPRPQFTLRALLVAMLVVAAFFGGARWGIWYDRKNRVDELVAEHEQLVAEQIRLNNTLIERLIESGHLTDEQKRILLGE